MANAGKRVVVLGGGVAGLTAGLVLKRKGYDVTIVEATAELGGLAISRGDGEFRWDLGPHNVHTHHTHVLDFLKRNFSDLFEHEVPSLVYKRGKLLTYPLKGLRIITTLPPVRLLQAVVSFGMARVRMLLTQPSKDDTFEDWIRNRFGNVLFREYFHNYPRKVWGLPTSQIDRYVAEKRVPVMNLLELVRMLILRKPPRIDHPEWTSKNFYLPNGIGEIPEFLSREFMKLGGVAVMKATPIDLRTEGGMVTAVSIRKSDESTEWISCDYCLSTIPVNDFVRLFPDGSQKLTAEVSQIDYVASVLLFLKTRRADVLPSKLLYFDEPSLLYSRVSDVGGFSRKMVPEGKNLICLEFPCSVGDDVWKKDLRQLTDHAISTLVERKILRHDDVYDSFIEKISHSYPRFRDGFRRRLDECLCFIGAHPNCLSFGRQGGFSYVNTDAVLHLGFKAASSVVMAESLEMSLSDWFYKV